MTIDNRELISLKIPTLASLIRLHDLQVEKLKLDGIPDNSMLVKVDSQFNKLRELLPEQYEWIKTNKQLYMESQTQHNCVYSYKKKVQMDMCAIYHYECEDRKYTIEFKKNKFGNYYITQMLQKYNKNYLEADYNYTNSLLNDDIITF